MAGKKSEAGSFKPLGGDQIRHHLSGKRLVSLPLPPMTYEDFHSDGRWRSWRGGRYVRMQEGRWLVSGDELCVVESGAKDCRRVWYDQASNSIRMRAPKSWRFGSDPMVLKFEDIK